MAKFFETLLMVIHKLVRTKLCAIRSLACELGLGLIKAERGCGNLRAAVFPKQLQVFFVVVYTRENALQVPPSWPDPFICVSFCRANGFSSVADSEFIT